MGKINGVVTDHIRDCKLAIDRGWKRNPTAPSPHFTKTPPVQWKNKRLNNN